QLLDAVASSDEHVAELSEVGLVPKGPVAGDDLGVVVGERQDFIGCGDHASDFTAGARVDIGIKAMEAEIARLNDIGLLKMNEDVGVSVSGGNVFQHECLAVSLQLSCRGKSLRGQGLGGRRWKMQAEHEQVVRLSHALLRVLMGENGGAGGVQGRVVVGVV